MSRDKSIWLITLETGHGSWSYRDQVVDAEVARARAALDIALAGGLAEIRPGYTLSGVAHGSALMATISMSIMPIATYAVAGRPTVSKRLWEEMAKPMRGVAPAVGAPPPAPWAASRVYPTINIDPGAALIVGALMPAIAWAWVEAGGQEAVS